MRHAVHGTMHNASVAEGIKKRCEAPSETPEESNHNSLGRSPRNNVCEAPLSWKVTRQRETLHAETRAHRRENQFCPIHHVSHEAPLKRSRSL